MERFVRQAALAVGCFLFGAAVLSADRFEYIPVSMFSSERSVAIRSIDDFERLALEADIEFLYRLETVDSDGERLGTRLLFLHDGVAVEFGLHNYLTIADFRSGVAAGFRDGAAYYASLAEPEPTVTDAGDHETVFPHEDTHEQEPEGASTPLLRASRHTLFIELLPVFGTIILNASGDAGYALGVEYRFAARDRLDLVLQGWLIDFDVSEMGYLCGVGLATPLIRRGRHRLDVTVLGGVVRSVWVFIDVIDGPPIDPDIPHVISVHRDVLVYSFTDLLAAAALEYRVAFSRIEAKIGAGPLIGRTVYRKFADSFGSELSTRDPNYAGIYLTAGIGWRF